MKNITVSVDDETYRLSRVKAAEAGTSLSAMVRQFLSDVVAGRTPEPEFERLRRQQDEMLYSLHARGGGIRVADNLPREDLYTRGNALS